MSKVCIGQIVNVHGIKGMVKIRPYLNNPMDIGRFGPLSDFEGHQSFTVSAQARKGDFVLASIKGIPANDVIQEVCYLCRNHYSYSL